VGPELAARVVASEDARALARLLVVGDSRVFAEGAAVAGVSVDVPIVADAEDMPGDADSSLLDLRNLDPATVKLGEAQAVGGRFVEENFRRAVLLCKAGKADAVVFTPFNKQALRMALPGYTDEIRYGAELLDLTSDVGEFNVLGELWNARVTSHVALSEVAPLVTRDAILAALRFTARSLKQAGVARAHIGVAALNPHAGDGGNFGREEIDVIVPAVAAAQSEGISCEGPYASDTVFVRARSGGFDAVLTMYHDQGQIAMKLMGFERGVTLFGGFPFPITTPAHGSAYDIAGKGVAHAGATLAAIELAVRMVRSAA
jgi:4-hydroxythreonine-4-phosphate dehydrogenase